jgi:hypothetical protein
LPDKRSLVAAEARPGAPERGTRPVPRREEKREEKKLEDKKPV